MQNDPFIHLPPGPRKNMLNRELVESTYRENTMREASKELGVSTGMLARALRHHGIRVRSKGERVNGRNVITRESLPKIVATAYHKANRCPPN